LLRALGLVKNHAKIHPATKVFQALRIAVNNELENVERGLRAAMGLVTPGGRVAAISFHSLEDRIVKNVFRAHGKVVTKKPVVASHAEIVANPRARSARLRIWENV
ncbi:MAG: 16S rRNA (cytosine(1402)-N(4))-methyltransferase, partial [Candidatus Ryanbacteria bacterium]|nr:16S rRNA (cytosine(1402)-N(4))-methyltransferase [Candidatus Ryanbacteria bacterium]